MSVTSGIRKMHEEIRFREFGKTQTLEIDGLLTEFRLQGRFRLGAREEQW